MSRFLRILSCLVVLLFSGNAFAASYPSTCSITYTKCATNRYLSNCGTSGWNGGTATPSAGNSCKACPSGYTCSGNTNCPVPVVTNVTVSYNLNGGSGTTPSATTCTAGNSCNLNDGTATTFYKGGAYLVGWSTSSTATSGSWSITPTANTTVYAVWSNCAIGSYHAASTGTQAKLCSVCTGGTTTSAAGKTSCDATCTNNLSSSSNVYAWATPTWSANSVSNKCKITSCKAGYYYTAVNNGTTTATYQNTCTACSTGYTTSNNNTSTSCSAKTYTVTLNANSGTLGTLTSVTATYNSAFPTITVNTNTMPKRAGYTFNGFWSATSGGTQYYNASGAPTTSKWTTDGTGTLYAQWTTCANGSFCNGSAYNSSTLCTTLGTAYTGSNGTRSANTDCYKACTRPCTQQTCPQNATCTHGSTSTSGTQQYNSSTCSASSSSCSISVSCSSGYYMTGSSTSASATCTACSNVNNTTSTTSCTYTKGITGGTQTWTTSKTCNGKYTGGAGGTSGSSACTGCDSYAACPTSGGTLTSVSCNTGYTANSSKTCDANCNRILLSTTPNGAAASASLGTGGTSVVYVKTGTPGKIYGDSSCTSELAAIDKPSKTNAVLSGYYSTSGVSGGSLCINALGEATGNCSVTGETLWYARYNCQPGYRGSGTMITSACSANTITINYSNSANGGTCSSHTCSYGSTCNSKSYNSSSCAIVNADNTKYLSGWNTASDGSGTTFAPGADIKSALPTSDSITLYAVYSSCPAASSSAHTSSVEVQDNVCVYTCSTGYSTSGGTNTGTTCSGNGCSCYAKCNSVTLDAAGTVATLYKKTGDTKWYKNDTCTTEWTGNSSQNVIPTRSGYTFRGYYADTVSDVSINSSTAASEMYINTAGNPVNSLSVTGPVTLYAAWAKNCAPTSPATCSLSIATTGKGAVTYTTACPSCRTIHSNGTYAPYCSNNTFTVTYNVNGGSGTKPNNRTCTYGSCTFDGRNTLYKSGYIFTGWNTNTSGTGTHYNVGAAYNSSCSDISLYAEWTAVGNSNCVKGTGVSSTSYNSTTTDNKLVCNVTCNNKYHKSGATTQTSAADATSLTVTCDSCTAASNGTHSTVAVSTSSNSCVYTGTCATGWTANGSATCSGNACSCSTAKCNAITLDAAGTVATLYKKTGDTKWYKNNTCTTEWTGNSSQNVIPTRSGYTFRGYYADTVSDVSSDASSAASVLYIGANGNSTSNGDSLIVDRDTTIYAAWARSCSATSPATCSLSISSTGSGAVDYTTACPSNGYTLNNNNAYNPSCTANTYTISYVLDGGTQANSGVPSSYTYGTGAKITGVPTKENHVFVGWCTDSAKTNCAVAPGITTTTTGNLTYYAKWSQCPSVGATGSHAASCTLSGVSNNSCTYTGSCSAGYKGFTYSGSTCSCPTAISYTVVYNKNDSGATGTMSNSSRTYGDGVALTSNGFSKTGYHFAGWATSASGSVVYANGATSNLTTTDGATVNLYAKWEANTYTVTFNGNSATSGSASTSSITCTYDQNCPAFATQNTLLKTNSTFGGWNTNTSGTGTTYAAGATTVKNLTSTNGGTVPLYAKWSACASGTTGSHAASCSVNGVSSNSCTYTGTCSAGYKGFTYSGSTCSCPTAISYTVVYNKNDSGATGTMSNSSRTYGDGVALTSNGFSKTGYHFAGWATSASGSVAYANGSTANLTSTDGATVNLYAKWEANTYTVTFNGNSATSGSASTSSITCTYDQNCPAFATQNTLLKTNNTFGGWNTNTSGTGTTYAAGATTVKNLTSTNGGTVPLYAKWSACASGTTGSHAASCSVNGVSSNSCTYTGSCSAGYKGFTYSGSTCSCPTANTYTVTFNTNNSTSGSASATSTNCTYGGNVTLATRNTLYKSGAIFTGWNTAANGSGTHYDAGASIACPLNGVTLYAEWTTPTCSKGTGVSSTSLNGTTTDNKVVCNVTCSNTYHKSGATTQTSAANATSLTVTCDSCTAAVTGTNAYSSAVNTNSSNTCVYTGTCKAGSANPVATGATIACEQCSAGTYQANNGSTATSCTNASKGHYVASAGASSQSTCESGKYQDTTGQSSCKSCPTLTSGYAYTSATGLEAVTSCTETRAATSISSLCQSGTLQKTAKNTTEWNTATESATVNAKSGSYVTGSGDGRTCSTCTKNSYCTGGTTAPAACSSISGTGGLYNLTASTGASAATQCYATCGGGSYVAKSTDTACSNVGAGYWRAAHTVNYGTTDTRTACASGLTTIGYGTGADEAGDCGRKLHVGGNVLYLRSDKKTTPSLNVKIQVGTDYKTFYANMTSGNKNMGSGQSKKLKVKNASGTYSVHDDSAN